MAKVIWKYEIPLEADFTIEMPKGARILKVMRQHELPVMWAMVDDTAEKEKRKFFVEATGSSFDKAGKYIGTCMVSNDRYVFHLFEAADTD
jgi:hypothetical protein